MPLVPAAQFLLNGVSVDVPSNWTGLSAYDFIRQHTSCKSVKHGCGDGGCGACAVEVVRVDPATGETSTRAINSCLAPVTSLDGCHVLTSEGLGSSAAGFHPIQERLAAFHATQCGFCTPGIAVSAHAALATCAQMGAKPTAQQLCQALDGNLCRCTGYRPIIDTLKSFVDGVPDIEDLGLCSLTKEQLLAGAPAGATSAAALATSGGCGSCSKGPVQQHSNGASGGGATASGMQHIGGTAGGKRPASPGGTGEDGTAHGTGNGAAASTANGTNEGGRARGWGWLFGRKKAPAAAATLPRSGVKEGSPQQQLAAGDWVSAATVEEAMQVMQAAAEQGVAVQLVAGNTGAGLHPQLWQLQRNSVSMQLANCRQLQEVELRGSCLHMGACVTLTQLLEQLQRVPSVTATSAHDSTPRGSCDAACDDMCSAPSDAADGIRPSSNGISNGAGSGSSVTAAAACADTASGAINSRAVNEMVAHLQRVAGTLVRNAATVGGNLVLARQRALESDVATIFMAAGAKVQVTSLSSCATSAQAATSPTTSHWYPIEQFLQDTTNLVLQQLGSSCLVTAVQLPLPAGPQEHFWSHKVALHRHSNEKAAVNMSVWVRLSAAAGASSSTAGTATGGDHGGGAGAPAIAITGSDMGTSAASPANGVHSNGVAATNGNVLGSAVVVVDVRISVGFVQASSSNSCSKADSSRAEWRSGRAAAVERCLRGQHVTAQLLCDALRALGQDIVPTGRHAEYLRCTANGLLLQALASILPVPADDRPELQRLLQQLERSPLPSVAVGRQELPDNSNLEAPLYWPTEKVTAKLQASGEALFSEDEPLQLGALYGALVLSTHARATIESIDASAALALEGVVRFVSASDIPPGGRNTFGPSMLDPSAGQPLFAHAVVEFVGQPIGLVLATSLSAARQAAERVRVAYGPAEGPALLTMEVAAAAGAFHTASHPFIKTNVCIGDVEAALKTAIHRVKRGQLRIAGQQHWYMEPQTAVAAPDEGGGVHVHCSAQGTDYVQTLVSQVLNLPHNQVTITCKRLGGGFGGKVGLAQRIAAAAALAASLTKRQVRLPVERHADSRMGGGRCAVLVTYDAAWDVHGRVAAIDMDVLLEGGAFADSTWVEVVGIAHHIDNAYSIPNLRCQIRLARCNLPPRTTVRAPGDVSAVLIMEHIMQRIALELGTDAACVREVNMLTMPRINTGMAEGVSGSDAAGEGSVSACGVAAPGTGNHNAGGDAGEAAAATGSGAGDGAGGRATGEARDGENGSSDDGAGGANCHGNCNGTSHHAGGDYGLGMPSWPPHPSTYDPDATMQPTLGKPMPLRQFTLPYMWAHLKRASGYDDRVKQVQQYNSTHVWRKRGIAMTPAKFLSQGGRKVALVSIYSDGSILIAHAGVEMGQGIATKVVQTAAHTLGQLLDPQQRPALLPLIRSAPCNTQLLPHGGLAAGSTTSEGATYAIRGACQELVERLRPAAEKLGRGAQWVDIIKAVCPMPGFGSTVLLSAYSQTPPPTPYCVWGVAVAEVEVDVLTGERRVLRSDLMMDLGRPVNVAVDLGQVEGAFIQGLGHVMCEEVVIDSSDGTLQSFGTWTYKVPSIADVPEELNVHMLHDSPSHVDGLLSAKACGEPPLLLAASVSCAFQAATHVAHVELAALGSGQGALGRMQKGHRDKADDLMTSSAIASSGQYGADDVGGFRVLNLPATTAEVQQACGHVEAAAVLACAMGR